MQLTIFAMAAAALAAPAVCAAAPVPMDAAHWTVGAEVARFEPYRGRASLYLKDGEAHLVGPDFRVGVIEFDMAVGEARAFVGVSFRRRGRSYEHFYIRPQMAGAADSNQYTPVFNGVSGWQIYTGDGFTSAMRYPRGGWMHVKLVVADTAAEIHVGDNPPLRVPDLKGDRQGGGIAFDTAFAGAHYSNVRVSRGPVSLPRRETPPRPARPPGHVEVWQVSPAMGEARARAAAESGRWAEERALRVEANGVANLARVAARTPRSDTAIAHVRVRADRAMVKTFRFGFSDRVAVYLNGERLYEGDDTFQSRDPRFLGTVGLFDTLPLHLRAGDNDLALVVGESFGGWAAVGRFEDAEGLTLVTPAGG